MTTYVVCPHCHHVHPAHARTIPALTHHIWQVASALVPPGERVVVTHLALAANVSYPTAIAHIGRLVEVGLVARTLNATGTRGTYRVVHGYVPVIKPEAEKHITPSETKTDTLVLGEELRSPATAGETTQGAAVTTRSVTA